MNKRFRIGQIVNFLVKVGKVLKAVPAIIHSIENEGKDETVEGGKKVPSVPAKLKIHVLGEVEYTLETAEYGKDAGCFCFSHESDEILDKE